MQFDSNVAATSEKSKKEEVKVKTILKLRREAASNVQPRPTVKEPVSLKPTACKRILQCVTVNVACVLVLQLMILPLIRFLIGFLPFHLLESWNANLIRDILSLASILPVFLITRAVNALWFSDIANASLKYRKMEQVAIPSISRAMADFVVAILVEIVFVLQSMLTVYIRIPIVGPFITFFHLSLLHALYSFEYLWMSCGYELKIRLAAIEQRWPYFVGFGTPLTLLTFFSNNFVVSGCLFGMFFPFFIISSYLADVKIKTIERQPVLTVHIFWPSLAVTNRISSYLSAVALARKRPNCGDGVRLIRSQDRSLRSDLSMCTLKNTPLSLTRC